MNADAFIKAELARFAIAEAFHFGGVNNMLAVCFAVRNRVGAGWEGGDWLQVIKKAPKFAGKLYHRGCEFSLRDPAVKQLFQQIDDLYSGFAEDTFTEGALFYCDLTDGRPRPWFRAHILRRLEEHPLIATVGPVSFFR